MVQSVSANLYSVVFAVKRETVAVCLLHSNNTRKVYNILLSYFQRIASAMAMFWIYSYRHNITSIGYEFNHSSYVLSGLPVVKSMPVPSSATAK